MSTEEPYPGGGLPERYRRTLDPYVALSVIAAQTDLKIGTCVSLVAQHDPIALAKTIATLDHLSGGRFRLGVGYGWNLPELANHGHEASKRRAIVREHVALMRALWQDTKAEFHGEHANLSPSWAWPKPTQRPAVPRPPWLPSDRSRLRRDRPVGGPLDRLRQRPGPVHLAGHDAPLAVERGRSWGGRPSPLADARHRRRRTLRRSLDRFLALGVDQLVLDLQAAEDNLLPILDRYATVLATT